MINLRKKTRWVNTTKTDWARKRSCWLTCIPDSMPMCRLALITCLKPPGACIRKQVSYVDDFRQDLRSHWPHQAAWLYRDSSAHTHWLHQRARTGQSVNQRRRRSFDSTVSAALHALLLIVLEEHWDEAHQRTAEEQITGVRRHDWLLK